MKRANVQTRLNLLAYKAKEAAEHGVYNITDDHLQSLLASLIVDFQKIREEIQELPPNYKPKSDGR